MACSDNGILHPFPILMVYTSVEVYNARNKKDVSFLGENTFNFRTLITSDILHVRFYTASIRFLLYYLKTAF